MSVVDAMFALTLSCVAAILLWVQVVAPSILSGLRVAAQADTVTPSSAASGLQWLPQQHDPSERSTSPPDDRLFASDLDVSNSTTMAGQGDAW